MENHQESNRTKLGRPFGQREPLTRRLSELIRSYPKGVGIIQEFIQNADDAGASIVKIVIDWRKHASARLPSKSMKSLMGPSLLIYNDKVFSDSDLIGIQEIGRGDKFQSSAKTGRFGLGFNACYNITDFPSFISRDGIYFFDPHCKTVVGANVDNPGRSWELNQQTWESYPDLFTPFQVLGLEVGQTDFEGTIFRLPLRTKNQASVSEISHEPFTKRDIRQLFAQLTEIGPELLIFLKYVTHIRVDEILEDGQLAPLLEITTENKLNVQDKRDVINQKMLDDPSEMVDFLRRSGQIAVSYLHEIHLKTLRKDEEQVWRVVNGLFLDDDHEVLDCAKKMIAEGEKSIPWAGAAVQLSSSTKKKLKKPNGRIYCFLPLPIESEFPVHLNAFFDVDSSRTQTTANKQNLIGNAEIRSDWNEAIIRHCVAQAYANLIEYLVDDIGKDDPQRFYQLWPDITNKSIGTFANLSSSVYGFLRNKCVICSAKDQTWVNVGSIFLVPQGWNKIKKPIIESKMPVPEPDLPSYIAKGFESANIQVKTLWPQNVRDHFRINHDLDIPLKKLGSKSLREKDTLAQVLKFCLSDHPTANWVIGLPFALLADGKVHTFGKFPAGAAYIANKEEREIFPQFQEWFIDAEYAKKCELEPITGAKLFKMEPVDVISKLRQILVYDEYKSLSSWEPNSTTIPNLKWLTKVFNYIAANKKAKDDIQKKIENLHIVPDQFGMLWEMKRASTPLLPRAGTNQGLKDALTAIGIPLVSGTETFLKAAQNLVDSLDSLIWYLTPVDLIDTLEVLVDMWSKKLDQYDAEIVDPILDYFSAPETIKSLASDSSRKSKIIKLPLFPTTDGDLVNLEDSDVFLAANYDPPTVAGKIRLYYAGPDNRWKSLYRTLAVQELDQATLITQVLIPNYANLDFDHQYSALEWIRDNRSKAEAEYSKRSASASDLKSIIAETPLIHCDDGSLSACTEIYDPREKKGITAILGNQAVFPDMKFYKKKKDLWFTFFDDLGIKKVPQAADLLKVIGHICDHSVSNRDPALISTLEDIFRYLSRVWSNLAYAKVLDEETNQIRPLVEILREKHWLPAQRDPKQSKFAGFVVPEDRLFQPGELFVQRDGHLIASQRPILSFQEPIAKMRTDLGFCDPSLDVVISHFDYLLQLWEKSNHGGLRIGIFENTLGEIYKYFGLLFEKARKTSEAEKEAEYLQQLARIRENFQNRPCIWEANAHDNNSPRMWKPIHVFQESVPYFSPLRRKIQDQQDLTKDHGYEALGRKVSPDADDFVDFLEEYYTRTDGHLQEENIEQVLHILWRLTEFIRGEEDIALPGMFLPSQDGRLVHSENMYEADAPWFEGRIDENIPLLHKQVNQELIEILAIKRLSECVVEELAEEPSPLPEESKEYDHCQELEDTLRSNAFQKGLIRLVRKDGGVFRPGDFNWLTEVRVVPVHPIRTEMYLNQNGYQEAIGSGQTEYYFDPEQNTIYLTAQSVRLMDNYLAKAINQQMEQPLGDLSSLITIVNTPVEEIEITLNKLRVPKLDYLPYSGNNGENLLDGDFEDNLNAFMLTNETDEGDDFSSEVQEDNELASELFDRTNLQQDEHAPQIATSIVQGIVPNSGDEVPPPIVAGDGTSNVIQPPTMPRRTASTSRYGPSRGSSTRRRSRDSVFISRVFHGNSSNEITSEINDSRSIAIGNKAVERVLEYEQKFNRRPVQMSHSNPGYDIESYDIESNQLVRYIEVKGIDGTWEVNGVNLRPRQFQFAREHPDIFWFYVVEDVFDDDACRIYPIPNLAAQITEFRFDQGWKVLAKVDKRQYIPPSRPAIGMNVRLDDDQIALIMDVKEMDGVVAVIRLKLLFQDGTETWHLYRPNQMQLIANQSEFTNGSNDS